jgi:hypothetical protein
MSSSAPDALWDVSKDESERETEWWNMPKANKNSSLKVDIPCEVEFLSLKKNLRTHFCWKPPKSWSANSYSFHKFVSCGFFVLILMLENFNMNEYLKPLCVLHKNLIQRFLRECILPFGMLCLQNEIKNAPVWWFIFVFFTLLICTLKKNKKRRMRCIRQ